MESDDTEATLIDASLGAEGKSGEALANFFARAAHPTLHYFAELKVSRSLVLKRHTHLACSRLSTIKVVGQLVSSSCDDGWMDPLPPRQQSCFIITVF